VRLKIKAFGGVAWAMGTRTVEVELPTGAVVADLLAHLLYRYPGLAPFIPPPPVVVGDVLMVVVGKDEVSGGHPLCDGDEVLLVLPASGGAPTPEEDGRSARRLYGPITVRRSQHRAQLDRAT